VTNSKRWTLVVDPQEQGNAWIKKCFRGTMLTGSMLILKGQDAFSEANAAATEQVPTERSLKLVQMFPERDPNVP
jgi:hypothetical protein